ncbi:hypothetical protein AB0K74_48720, partial [Streptomyces sp. NPDC056159]
MPREETADGGVSAAGTGRVPPGCIERRAYLARVVGYSVTASTGEQVMFIHHGEGQNGKGVFMRVVMGLPGEY